MTSGFLRDIAASAALFGFVTSVWLGWAQESPPQRWRAWLTTGSIVGLACTVAGGILVWRHWNDGTAFDADTSPKFGIVVAIEFVLAGIGCVLLARRGKKELMAAWVALVVGLHFIPLAILVDYAFFHIVAVLVSVAAIVSVPLARRRGVYPSAMTGLLTGSVFLVAAYASLITALTF